MRKHLIYLASGSSRRFGENKLLYSLNGKPMFLYGLELLCSVAGSRADCEVMLVSRYPVIRQTARSMGVRAVDSPDSEKGISHTIRAALAALGEVPKEDFLLFLAADQPWLTAGSLEKLLALAESGAQCACLSWNGMPGNPALFSAGLIPELGRLEGDTGGRAILRRHDCLLVQADSAKELEDIDTKAEV